MARTPLIAGNWKMNLDHLEAIKNIQKLTFALPKEYYEQVDIAVLAPFTDLRSIQTVVSGEKMKISYGAQNLASQEKGAYTGDTRPCAPVKTRSSLIDAGSINNHAQIAESMSGLRDRPPGLLFRARSWCTPNPRTASKSPRCFLIYAAGR